MKSSKDEIHNIALRYNSQVELKKSHPDVYNAILYRGWNETAFSHMERKWSVHSLEECFNILKEYKSVKDAREKNPKIYSYVKRKGWLKECTAHMSRRIIWTHESCRLAFLSCTTLKQVQGKYGSAWNYAHRNGLLEECSGHLNKKKTKDGTWTYDNLKKLFAKFDKIDSLVKLHNGAYQTAVKKGWLKDFTSHMSGFGNSSSLEERLLNIVKDKYPSSHQKWFGKNKKGEIAKRFQLDIFIPELNKGIEFDGDYWHSYESLKRGRPSWPDEMVRDYHNIKDNFFKSYGVEIIRITEDQWKKNEAECLKVIFNFLENK
jgi:hypothetical protein